MGYYSRVTGEIAVTPPILVRDMPGNPFTDARATGMPVQFHVEETAVDVDEGTLIRREITAIVPVSEDGYKAYGLDRHLAQAVQLIRDAGSTCKGELVRTGEDQGDIERYTVGNDTTSVLVEKARMTWPDGTGVEL